MRMLLKLATSGATPLTEAKFGAAGASVSLRHLFAAGTAPAGPGVAAAAPAAWYIAEASPGSSFGATSAHPWDLAHAALRDHLAGKDVSLADAAAALQTFGTKAQQLADLVDALKKAQAAGKT